jgi:hypothetical protein
LDTILANAIDPTNLPPADARYATEGAEDALMEPEVAEGAEDALMEPEVVEVAGEDAGEAVERPQSLPFAEVFLQAAAYRAREAESDVASAGEAAKGAQAAADAGVPRRKRKKIADPVFAEPRSIRKRRRVETSWKRPERDEESEEVDTEEEEVDKDEEEVDDEATVLTVFDAESNKEEEKEIISRRKLPETINEPYRSKELEFEVAIDRSYISGFQSGTYHIFYTYILN